MSVTCVVEIDPQFQAYKSDAILRLGYLYPQTKFWSVDTGIEFNAEATEIEGLRQEISFAVYRQRIFEKTLPLRRQLIDGLLAK